MASVRMADYLTHGFSDAGRERRRLIRLDLALDRDKQAQRFTMCLHCRGSLIHNASI